MLRPVKFVKSCNCKVTGNMKSMSLKFGGESPYEIVVDIDGDIVCEECGKKWVEACERKQTWEDDEKRDWICLKCKEDDELLEAGDDGEYDEYDDDEGASEYQKGDWVRFMKANKLVIGEIEYVEYVTETLFYHTDFGAIHNKSVLECRRKACVNKDYKKGDWVRFVLNNESVIGLVQHVIHESTGSYLYTSVGIARSVEVLEHRKKENR